MSLGGKHSHEGPQLQEGAGQGYTALGFCSVCLTVGRVALASMALVGSHDLPGSPELCQLSLETACSSEATYHLTYLCFTYKHTWGICHASHRHTTCLSPHTNTHHRYARVCMHTQVHTTHKYICTVHRHTCTHSCMGEHSHHRHTVSFQP